MCRTCTKPLPVKIILKYLVMWTVLFFRESHCKYFAGMSAKCKVHSKLVVKEAAVLLCLNSGHFFQM